MPLRSWELRAVWLVLGLLLAMALPADGRLLLGLTLLGWLLGEALLLWPRSAASAAAAVDRLLGHAGGRMTLLVTLALVGLAALATNLFLALLLLTWCGTLGLLLAPFIGEDRLTAIWQRAATAGAAIALTLVALEGVFRLHYMAARFGPPSEELAWERRYDSVAAQNPFGFRTVHQTVGRTPGVRRLLALGDSFTWGDKIASTDSIWPSLLETELSRSYPGQSTEVINISHRGWSMTDEVRMLDRIGWQFQPDRLLVQFYVNDTDAPRGDPDAHPRHPRPPTALRGGLLQTSALASFLRHGYTATLGQGRQREILYGSFEEGSAGWNRLKAGLGEVADSAHARGIPVTLVLFPAFSPGRWTAENHPLRQIYGKVARAAEADGVEVLDLTPAYAEAAAGADWRRWWATPYDRHPNAEAHLIAARTIVRFLVEHGWGRSD